MKEQRMYGGYIVPVIVALVFCVSFAEAHDEERIYLPCEDANLIAMCKRAEYEDDAKCGDDTTTMECIELGTMTWDIFACGGIARSGSFSCEAPAGGHACICVKELEVK